MQKIKMFSFWGFLFLSAPDLSASHQCQDGHDVLKRDAAKYTLFDKLWSARISNN